MTDTPLHNLTRFEGSRLFKKFLTVLLVIGIGFFAWEMTQNAHRAWANFLINYFYWLSIALFGLFFAALQHITGSHWSVTVRRVAESFIAYLPVSLGLFVVLLFGLPHLYEWTHPHVMETDPILKLKTGYLNTPFFIIRHAGLYILCFVLGGKLVQNSLRQDKENNAHLTVANSRLSAPFLLLFAILYTLAAVDLMMSLAPHWFSTIFGVYCWAGLMYSGLAMLALWVIVLRKKGILSDWVSENHLHDIGKLMFAFLVFWGYIAFSQYMLIWYANLPEETPYLILRTQGPYQPISLALMLGKFVIPFFLLVSRPAKRNQGWLAFCALWFLIAQWLDVYWMVIPAFFEKPVFGMVEIGIFLGFGALFLWSVGTFLRRVNAVAIHDPRIKSALHHHQ